MTRPRINTVIDQGVLDWLREEAGRTGRTLTGQISWVVKQYREAQSRGEVQ